ncbi:MAG TPA: SRPBCC family protein [Burkholderiales bacterium]|nr:SRPBCC family protein [Burkholderiales bacterium]
MSVPRGRDVTLLALLLLPAAADAARAQVEVERHGEQFEVRASAQIAATVERAWRVLTDYGRLAHFIPGMLESRVVSRDGPKVVVDQRGEATLLFLTFPMQVRLEVAEQPYEGIVSTAIAGNFKDLHGAYRLAPSGSGVSLRYEGRFTPDFEFPPLLGTLIVRSTAQKRFEALILEIEREASGATGSPGR